ncbi:hypothetical protein KY290_007676 [Solanum tuberosum]|uniref:Uncharacterized protein n=1 Tax=Solanum tuberosum TaxID=4113 RepID=A0ABQ7W8F0_SOLTU|nr:hypothetical protein KY290_007676 [Solanum tuberosum]
MHHLFLTATKLWRQFASCAGIKLEGGLQQLATNCNRKPEATNNILGDTSSHDVGAMEKEECQKTWEGGHFCKPVPTVSKIDLSSDKNCVPMGKSPRKLGRNSGGAKSSQKASKQKVRDFRMGRESKIHDRQENLQGMRSTEPIISNAISAEKQVHTRRKQRKKTKIDTNELLGEASQNTGLDTPSNISGYQYPTEAFFIAERKEVRRGGKEVENNTTTLPLPAENA